MVNNSELTEEDLFLETQEEAEEQLNLETQQTEAAERKKEFDTGQIECQEDEDYEILDIANKEKSKKK